MYLSDKIKGIFNSDFFGYSKKIKLSDIKDNKIELLYYDENQSYSGFHHFFETLKTMIEEKK